MNHRSEHQLGHAWKALHPASPRSPGHQKLPPGLHAKHSPIPPYCFPEVGGSNPGRSGEPWAHLGRTRPAAGPPSPEGGWPCLPASCRTAEGRRPPRGGGDSEMMGAPHPGLSTASFGFRKAVGPGLTLRLPPPTQQTGCTAPSTQVGSRDRGTSVLHRAEKRASD